MNPIKRFLQEQFSAPFHLALVASFTLVAALTIGVGDWVISRTINDYLSESMNERVAHNAHLARSIYNARQEQVTGISYNLAKDAAIAGSIEAGDEASRRLIGERLQTHLQAPGLDNDYCVVLLDSQGNIVAWASSTSTWLDNRPHNGKQATAESAGNWGSLPIVRESLQTSRSISSTEIIPAELLAMVGLAEQAKIELLDTPRAAPEVFDPREGSGGLALLGVTPLETDTGEVAGLALALHLFNNDFSLVDRIKDIAQIDTVTIFLGDLRVSTNVMTSEGQRAVGTRLAADVGEVVLKDGQEYVGTAFVVNENYITRYEPLHNQAGEIIGILYVGARQSTFFRLLDEVGRSITLAALVMVLFTFLLATPVTRVITDPLKNLREMAQVSKRVAQGETTVRMPVTYGGEVGQLATEFNAMLDTLHATREQLVHSENLASLGQLAAGVAHELNNPLGTILLYAESAQRECAEDDPHCADLDVIVKETKRCKRIVADLLNFSRQHQVIAQPTDINALLQELVEMAPHRIKTVTIPIVTEFDPNLPIIEGDTAQLRQVFLNLMTNAVEAMPEGGTMTIRTRRGPSQMVTVEIEDTGVGIRHEDLGKLFTPFFTTKPIGKGTGLGLAISYGIIKMHRGQINVKSQVGQGTTFIISLPIKLSVAEQPGAPQAANETGKVLIG
jgi:two-component system NtrC family sensor kinase